jgi:hypothetical protein
MLTVAAIYFTINQSSYHWYSPTSYKVSKAVVEVIGRFYCSHIRMVIPLIKQYYKIRARYVISLNIPFAKLAG